MQTGNGRVPFPLTTTLRLFHLYREEISRQKDSDSIWTDSNFDADGTMTSEPTTSKKDDKTGDNVMDLHAYTHQTL